MTKRVSFDIDDELAERVDKQIPHGVKAAVLRDLLDMLVTTVENNGKMILGAILDGDIVYTYKKK